MGKILDSVLKDNTLQKIGKLVNQVINQNEKMEELTDLLGKCGLKVFDSGTNRFIFKHKEYPKAVFKVALDEQGILDNLNEYEKSDKSTRFPDSYDIDSNGYILVQRRDNRFNESEFKGEKVQKGIRKMLKELEDTFILLDLGMDKRKNFGKDENGDYTIIDFGYVTYKELGNFNCPLSRIKGNGKAKPCKGTLQYNKTFSMMECDECGNSFKVDVVLEGHGEHKYVTLSKVKEFVPSPELTDFYKKFNDSRDRELLTEYVKINTKSKDTNTEGGNKPVGTKERFLMKARGMSGNSEEKTAEKQPVTEPTGGEEKEVKEGTQLIGKGVKSTKKAEVLKLRSGVDALPLHDAGLQEDEDVIASKTNDLVKVMTRMLPDGAIGDDVISALFYKRFPDIRTLVDTVEMRNEMASSGIIDVEDYVKINTTESPVMGICINLDAPQSKGQQPIIYTMYNGVVYQLDIVKHMELLHNATVDDLNLDAKEVTAVISYMYAEPQEGFTEDYEEKYKGDPEESADNGDKD